MNVLLQVGKIHKGKLMVCKAMLSLSFNSPIALILTPIANLLLYG